MELRYNAAGSKEFVGEWGGGSSFGTHFEEYDPFGRPGKIEKADGSVTNLIYTGVGRTRTITRVWNGKASEEAKAATYFDGEGRPFVVKEANGTRTRYHYDAVGHLTSVEQNIGKTPRQYRKFRYDGRGFLVTEEHPESGVTNYWYDALGNVIRSNRSGSNVRFRYDPAGRLINVYNPRTDANLKEYVYAPNGPWKGKLTDERAFNWRLVGAPAACTDFTVAHAYTYNSRGLVQDKVTGLSQHGTPVESFTQSYGYDEAGRVSSVTYPRCLDPVKCAVSSAPTVLTNYSYGRTSSVTGYANSISYNTNGTVRRVLHSNGVEDLITEDPSHLPRPRSISAKLGNNFVWAQQDYAYDPSGNITAIGAATYGYDTVSRLTSASIPGLTPNSRQEYTYDVFGNITKVCTSTIEAGCDPFVGVNFPTSGTNNRLSSASYNLRGSLTVYSGSRYSWDRFDNLATVDTGSETWTHTYDASNERVWSWRTSPSRVDTYSLRDLGGKLLREYKLEGALTFEDYIYRDGQALAAVNPSIADPSNRTRHFHLDHLGSVRRITNATGSVVGTHDMWPYGEEYTSATDGQQMRFTGHERDLGVLNSAADDLDYMHARHYRPLTARFLAPDPVPTGRAMKRPQAWNRYSYVIGNPLKYIDPYGELWFRTGKGGDWEYLDGVDQITRESTDANGNTVLTVIAGRGTFLAFDGGQLILYGRDGSIRAYEAVSGGLDSSGRTQPGLAGVANRGPIPEGRYSFNPTEIQNWSDLSAANQAASSVSPIWQAVTGRKVGGWPGGPYAWGTQRVPLNPLSGTDTLGRSNFFIHGGSRPGSAGCIDLCGQAGDFFNAISGGSEDIEVDVDYP